MQKIKAEVHKDHTFHPKVRKEDLPDFEEKQRRFEKSLQAAKESNPHRKVKHEEFALLTDKLRGGHHRPAPEQLKAVEADIRPPAPARTLAFTLTRAFPLALTPIPQPHPYPYPYPYPCPHPYPYPYPYPYP